MTFWRLVMVVTTGVLFTHGAVAGPADCSVCETKRAKMEEQALNQEKTRELLGKNNAYLAMLSADQASKFLKVKSNVTIILKKLDEQKKHSAELERDFESSGCLSCKTNKAGLDRKGSDS